MRKRILALAFGALLAFWGASVASAHHATSNSGPTGPAHAAGHAKSDLHARHAAGASTLAVSVSQHTGAVDDDADEQNEDQADDQNEDTTDLNDDANEQPEDPNDDQSEDANDPADDQGEDANNQGEDQNEGPDQGGDQNDQGEDDQGGDNEGDDGSSG